MTIAIATNNRRLFIEVIITAIMPVELAMYFYDPTRLWSYYFSRRLKITKNKNGKYLRQITIALPVSPKAGFLKVSAVQPQQRHYFKIEKVTLSPMAKPQVWAQPDRHKFMNLAMMFAKQAGYLKTGTYLDKNHRFIIRYLPTITAPGGKELHTPARIHREVPRVEVSQKHFRGLSIPVRVAILAHEGCHFFNDTRSEQKADLCGIGYYLQMGFPKIEAIYALTKVFANSPYPSTAGQLERVNQIYQFVRSFTPTQTTSTVA